MNGCDHALPGVRKQNRYAIRRLDAEQQSGRPAFVAAVSELSRLPLIPGAGSLVVRDRSGTVLGAVGVSGATPDEDRACAEAGLAAVPH